MNKKDKNLEADPSSLDVVHVQERLEQDQELEDVREDTTEVVYDVVKGEARRELFDDMLEFLLSHFDNSREGENRAKRFFQGKEVVKFSLPRSVVTNLFGSDLQGTLSSFSLPPGRSRDKSSQGELDTMNLSLTIRMAETDSAFLKVKLMIPRIVENAYTLKMSAGSDVVDFEWGFTPEKENLSGLSVTRKGKTLNVAFGEELPETGLRDTPLEHIPLLLKKLVWLDRFFTDLVSSDLYKQVTVRLRDFNPGYLDSSFHELKKKEPHEVWGALRGVLDQIGTFQKQLEYRISARDDDVTLQDEEVLRNVHLTGSAVEAMECFGFDYKASFERDGFRFFLLPVIRQGRYLKCLFYVYDGKKLVPRLAYKSRSHQRWRIDSANSIFNYKDGSFGKGRFDYESETVPCAELDALFSSLEETPLEAPDIHYFSTPLDFEANTYEKEVQRAMPLPGFEREFYFPYPCTEAQAVEYIQNYLPKAFLPDFSKPPVSSRKGAPSMFFPEGFEVEEFNFTYAEKEFRIDMAHNENGDVWIDRIEEMGVPINSYGIKSQFQEFGFMKTKPYEYRDQIPDFLSNYTDEAEGDDLRDYVKRTRALDLLPIVQRYREQRGIFRK